MDSAARYTLIASVSITRKQCAARRGMTYSDLTENAELIEFVRDDLKDAIMYTEHKHGEKLDSLLSAVQSAKTVYDMFAAIETAIGEKLQDACDLFAYDLPKIDENRTETLEKMRIWKDENGGTVDELALLVEFLELKEAGNIGPELRFPDYIRECEGKNGTLTLVEG